MRMGIGFEREMAEIDICPGVAIHDEEGTWTELRQRSKNSAGCLQCHRALVAVSKANSILTAIAEHGADALSEPGQVDDHIRDPRARQRFQVIRNQRFACDG